MRVRTTTISALLLTLLLAFSGAASAQSCPAPPMTLPNCAQPGQMLEELDSVLRTGCLKNACQWRSHIRFDYNQWLINGSENLPVTAAAVALFYQPVQPGGDVRNWWQTFLEAQLGQRTTFPAGHPQAGQALPAKLTYFHGSEAFSFTYDSSVVASVLAVHLWAQRTPSHPLAANIQTLARKYLRATWGVYGLAAGRGPGATAYRNEVFHTDKLQRGSVGFFYTGPYIAVGGARSNTTHWGQDDRGILFTRAAGRNFTGPAPSRESTGQQGVRTYVEGNWPITLPESAYGLSGTDRTAYQAFIDSDAPPSFLAADFTNIRTLSTIHFFAQNGFSGSCVENVQNGNGQGTFGVGWFANANLGTVNQEVQFLQPTATNGSGSCTYDSTLRELVGRDGAGTVLGRIRLLAGSLIFHYRLSSSGLTRIL